MFFPISDDDRSVTTVAYVTYSLLVLNVVMFAYQSFDPEFTAGWSMVPKEITTGQDLVAPQPLELPGGRIVEVPQSPGPPVIWLTLISSLFLHGSFWHLAGNMLYLWIFGDNVEHRFGHVCFLVLYLLSGVTGSLAQIAIDPGGIIPNLGASGAIAGVMGAYLVLFPHNKVNVIFFVFIVSVPAFVVLGMWGVTQFVSSMSSMKSNPIGGVAYMAHLSGLITGLAAGWVARTVFKEEPDSVLKRNYDRDPHAYRIW